MSKFEKGSPEAIAQAQKMRDARDKKKMSIQELAGKIMEKLDGFETRLQTIEGTIHISSIDSSVPRVIPKESIKPTGLELLPQKAKEILETEFPEAKIVSVVPWAGGGFAINIDVTHITGGAWITAMVKGKQTQVFQRDIRDIPVKSMELEKSMKARIKTIKQNMGWIKKEATPEYTEKELKPEERPLPKGIDGTPEAEFFSTDVK